MSISNDVHKIQVKLLKKFNDICELHNIEYQLFAGTLLGAIRHKGFIPWDDDIDVCMLRKDYDVFIEKARLELGEQFFLQTQETDKNYIMPFAKLRMNNTTFLEKANVGIEMHHGIYIDIFPFDNIYPDTFFGKVHLKKLRIIGRINLLRNKNLCLSINSRWKSKFCFFLNTLIKVIPTKMIIYYQNKYLRHYNNKNTEYVCHLTNGVSKDRIEKYITRSENFCDVIVGVFENECFPIPKDNHNVLKRLYGDYMVLPEKSQREPHHNIIKILTSEEESEK